MDLPDLDNVDEEKRGPNRTKFYMQTWLSNNDTASWKEFIDALKGMRLNRQAAQLTEMLSAAPATQHSVPPPPVPSTSGLTGKKSDFGIFLLDDTQGSAVRNIESRCHGDPEGVVKEILRQWLQGQGTPVTWENLISTLRDIDLNVLASEIEQYVKGV